MEFFDGTYMKFPHKHYGRIFVENEEDIAALKQIIKEMDDFEYRYLPNDLITVFSDENMRQLKNDKIGAIIRHCGAWKVPLMIGGDNAF